MKSIILLDRSGSMQGRWSDVAGTLQHYVDGLPEGTKTWLAAFDNVYDLVWDGTENKAVQVAHELQAKTISPRGSTALFDSIGKLAGLVAEVGKKRVQIAILTDGMENASKEVTREGAAKIIKDWADKEYDVVFLGADFDAFGQAGDVGIARRSTMSFSSHAGGAATGQALAERGAAYAAGAATQSLDFTDEQRKRAAGE